MEILEFNKKITTIENRQAMVRIMTPDGYWDGSKRYPVVYINDGQDVFRDEHIIWGKCSMDYEDYYRSYGKFMPDFIIVAIDCPRGREKRTEQYLPFTKYFKGDNKGQEEEIMGKGKEYAQWIAKELKPWVDINFSTKPYAENTAMCGYSTGGLHAIYTVLAYPEHFTRLIAMSSSVAIWIDEVREILDWASYDHMKYIYMDVGTNEFGRITTKEEFLQGAEMLYNNYIDKGVPPKLIKYNIYPDARHTQNDWKMRFPDALRWIFQDC